MSRLRLGRPHVDVAGHVTPAVLVVLTSWVALMAWSGFVEAPSEFLVPALAGVLLVAATGVAGRALHQHALVVLGAQLVVVGLWLTHRWAPDAALGGWVPTGASVSEALVLLRRGATAAQEFQAPVPESAPEVSELLLLAGVLVAVVVDFLAWGLRRVPAAGLPLLAVYTAPVSILAAGVPWWIFAAGAAGFLSMLVSDEGRRLQLWGRQVSRTSVVDSGDGPVEGRSIRASARRIGVTSTALAVVAPLVVPTFGGFLGGDGPGGEGGGDIAINNPMVNLRRDLVRGRDIDLLTVRTDSTDPSYLRTAVLDVYDGSAWRPSERELPTDQRADGVMPAPPGLDNNVPRRQVTYDISVEDEYESKWLPTPYPVTAIDVPGDWRYDLDTFDFVSFAEGQLTGGLEYSLSALEVTPTPEDLAAAGPTPQQIFNTYTDLPEGLTDTVATLAREVTAGARTRYERAAMLQKWFRTGGGFEYSLTPSPGTGADDLETFLQEGPDGREGYCEQFSASMALMGRTLGIPSRVAVGFLEPRRVGDGEYVYSAWDLHAWPEMYFEGAGWVRFEPTPADRAQQVPGWSTGRITTPEPTQLPSASRPTQDPEQANRQRREDPAAAVTSSDSGGGSRELLLTLLAVLLTAFVVALPWLLRTLLRRRRWATATGPVEVAEAGWRELRDTALDLRLGWSDGETLRTRARGLSASFGRPGENPREGFVRGGRGPEAAPGAAHALERLVRDVERARYSRGAGTVGPGEATQVVDGRGVEEVRADVEECTAALRAGATPRRRRWATLLPSSLVRNDTVTALLRRPGTRTGPVATGVDRAV